MDITLVDAEMNSRSLYYTGRNFEEIAEILHSMKADVASKLMRRSIEI